MVESLSTTVRHAVALYERGCKDFVRTIVIHSYYSNISTVRSIKILIMSIDVYNMCILCIYYYSYLNALHFCEQPQRFGSMRVREKICAHFETDAYVEHCNIGMATKGRENKDGS